MGRETLYKRSTIRELWFGFVTIAAIGQNEQNVIIDNEANIILDDYDGGIEGRLDLPKKKWGWGEETIKICQVSLSFFFILIQIVSAYF